MSSSCTPAERRRFSPTRAHSASELAKPKLPRTGRLLVDGGKRCSTFGFRQLGVILDRFSRLLPPVHFGGLRATRSNPVNHKKELDCHLATAPRNDRRGSRARSFSIESRSALGF